MTNYREIITINPEKRFGRPCVRNTRISVFDVLGWLASGMSNAQIRKDFQNYPLRIYLHVFLMPQIRNEKSEKPKVRQSKK